MTVLHVVYRTHPGTNGKGRPPWFSKAIALHSLQESATRVDQEVRWTYVADGGMSRDVAMRVRADDLVRPIRAGSASASLRRAVDVAVELSAHDPADTLYLFAEDDYLYQPHALPQLVAAARHAGPGAYLTLYTCDIKGWCATHPSQPEISAPADVGFIVGGQAWHQVGSTTSTMAVPRDALLADAGLLKLGTRAGAPFDLTTWSALQGIKPYPWRFLLRDLDGYPSARGFAKVLAKPPMRALLNGATALRPQAAHRVLFAPQEDLAMHLETEVMPPGNVWSSIAAGLSPEGPSQGVGHQRSGRGVVR